MSNARDPRTEPNEPMVYQIRLKGHLRHEWTDWFEGLAITLEENGDTLLTGPVLDQAALFGLLKEVRDLGMPLVSVNLMGSGPSSTGIDSCGSQVCQSRTARGTGSNNCRTKRR